MAITLRNVKNSALTHDEMDLNFSALTGSIEAGNGLQGGGSKSGSITLSVGQGEGIVVNAGSVRVDSTVARTGSNDFLGDQVIVGNVWITGSILQHNGTLGIAKGVSNGIDKQIRIGYNSTGDGRVWFAPSSGSPVQSNFNEEFGFEWTSEGSGRWFVETDLIVEKDLLVEKELRVKDNLILGNTTPEGFLDVGHVLLAKTITVDLDSGDGDVVVASVETGSYNGMIFDYILKKGSTYNTKVGTIQVARTGLNSTTDNNYQTDDIGSTSNVIFSSAIEDGSIVLKANAGSTDDWTIKGIVKGF